MVTLDIITQSHYGSNS